LEEKKTEHRDSVSLLVRLLRLLFFS